jgi:putative ABC transport system permease protein
MRGFEQDLRYGARALMNSPGFAVVAILSLALGIGLNTAMFTLVNAILLRSLPFPSADRLVAVYRIQPSHPDQINGASVPDLVAWRERSRSFVALGAAVNNAADFGAEENGTSAERLPGENVTPGLLRALGVSPMMGRLFTEEEDAVDHPAPVILISHRLWVRRFGSDPDILKRKVLVNGVNTSVVGVMPPNFRFSDETGEYFMPIPLNHFQLQGSVRFLLVAGRLKDGVSIDAAQAEIESLSREIARQFPARDMENGKPWGASVRPLRRALFGAFDRPLILLQGAVVFVLLIACANIAALLLARASSRHTEVAIRAALGAGRGRIFRQLLTESLLLATLGGLAGMLLAWGAVRVLVILAPPWLPQLHAVGIDARVLAFSAGLSLLTGLIFGLVPAAQGSRSTVAESLKDAARGGTSGGNRNLLRAALVSLQLALAFVLLTGSGLLIRSFLELQGANLGCDPKGLLTFRYRFPERQYAKPIGVYHSIPLWDTSPVPPTVFAQVLDRIRGVPGVRSAAGIIYPPMTGSYPINFTIEGRDVANAADLASDLFPITPNYFGTMKVGMLSGRDFTDRDTAVAPWVAIVNETMAHRYFPGEDPLGKRIRLVLSDQEQTREVVAVVKDMPSSHPQTKQDPAIFVPYLQLAPHITGPNTGLRLQMTYILRTQGEPMSALGAVRHAVEEIDRNRPLIDPRTEESYLNEQAQYPQSYSILFGFFAAVATALAAIGIYAVMTYAVEQRTREIGIRIALGAGAWDVCKLLSTQAAVVIACGVGAGLAGSLALTRFISSELWEVRVEDPATVGVMAALLIFVASFACWTPARRAMEVDPLTALRSE